MKSVNVTIRGIRPLLQHRPPDEDPEAYGRRKRNKPIKNDINKCLYLTKDKQVFQPAEHIFQAIKKVGARHKATGVKYATYKTLVMSYVLIEPEQIIHKNQEWVADRRSAVIPSTKGRIMVERPKFEDWELDFTILYDEDYIVEEDLQEILKEAGLTNGLGAYRPRFGLFEVTKWKKREDEKREDRI